MDIPKTDMHKFKIVLLLCKIFFYSAYFSMGLDILQDYFFTPRIAMGYRT
jgi:hypothetical protein